MYEGDNNMKRIYYIETTHNGYVTKKVPIALYDEEKDYCADLEFELGGELTEYYNDIAGNWDDIDTFLANGSNEECEEDCGDVKPNVYLEMWRVYAFGDNIVQGLMIE